MDDALTRVINEGRAEERIELLVSLCKAGHISIDIAAAQMHVSTDEFQKYLDMDYSETEPETAEKELLSQTQNG